MGNILLTGLLSVFILTSNPSIVIAEPGGGIIPDQKVMPYDPLFEKIGWCESKNILDAQNPYTTAGGEFQFLDGTWKYYGQKLWGDEWVNKDKKSLDNRELAWFVYTNYGTKDWEADPKSYECWKVEIPNAIYKKSP